jgi:hypothetical protein
MLHAGFEAELQGNETISAGYINGDMAVQDGGAHLRSSGIEDLLQWGDTQWEGSGRRVRKAEDGLGGRHAGRGFGCAPVKNSVTAFPKDISGLSFDEAGRAIFQSQ